MKSSLIVHTPVIGKFELLHLGLALLLAGMVYCLLCLGSLLYITRSAEVVIVNEVHCHVVQNQVIRDLLKTAGYKCTFSPYITNVFELGISPITPPWQIEVKTVGILTSLKQK
jgi:hypothetical protein